MRMSRRTLATLTGAVLAAGVAVAPTAGAVPAAGRGPASHPLGTRSLASVLAEDTHGFDHDSKDFDILTAAVGAVLKARPNSKVAVLANGKVALTAFLPTDGAFRRLVRDLTGRKIRSEANVFKAVAALGIPTVEKVLLYHVVPGATITARKALRSNHVVLTTATGQTLRIHVVRRTIILQDKDHNARNARVVVGDINKGNRQIAHAVDRVLRPLDLPPLAH